MTKVPGWIVVSFVLAAGCMPARGEGEEPVVLDSITVTGSKDLDTIPYAEEYKVIQKAAALDQLDKVQLRFFLRAKSKDLDLGTVRIHLIGDTINQNIPVSVDGVFALPELPAAAAEGALVVSNKPSGSLQLFYGPEIRIGSPEAMHYRDLIDGMSQSTKMMKSLWGFFFPSFVAVSIRFDAVDQYLAIGPPASQTRISALAGDRFVVIDEDKRLYELNPEVRFSTAPTRIVAVNVRPRRPTNVNE